MSKFISIFCNNKGVSRDTRECVGELKRKGFKLCVLDTHMPRCQFRNIVHHVYDARYADEYSRSAHVLTRAGITTVNAPTQGCPQAAPPTQEDTVVTWDVLREGQAFTATERPRKPKSLPVIVHDSRASVRVPTSTIKSVCDATADTDNPVLLYSDRHTLDDVPHEHEHRVKFCRATTPIDFSTTRALATNDQGTALRAIEAATPVFLEDRPACEHLVEDVSTLVTAKVLSVGARQAFLDALPRAQPHPPHDGADE